MEPKLHLVHCSLRGCFGVMELVSRSSASMDGLNPVHRLMETELIESGDEHILIYKCSCCNRLDFVANQALANRLNDRYAALRAAANLSGNLEDSVV